MPFVHIRIAGAVPAPAQLETLQREAAGLMVSILNKNAALTSVLAEPVAAGAVWAVGDGAPAVAAHLEANITAGSNTPAEQAAFIDAAAALLRRHCGPGLPVATYVVVRNIPGDGWGYDGVTQAARRASPDKPSA